MSFINENKFRIFAAYISGMNKALLIIDIQNDYFDQGKMPLIDSNRACANARLILDKFRTMNLPVIHIQHIAARLDAIFLLPATSGAEIHEALMPKENEIIIIKHFPNSFIRTELLNHLKSLEIKELVICGMMTHMCVDATVRAAKDFGFNCMVIGDACATKDLMIAGQTVKASEVQNSFLAALNYYYSTVKNTRQFLEENIDS
jgi:nicotinamidase-related amidase